MSILNEPSLGDEIVMLDITGLAGNKVSKVLRVVSYDPDEELWEVVDRYGQSRIITAGADDRQWIEVEL